MRGDPDFAAYVAARWPVLVRAAVLAGLAPREARAATADVLADLRPAWGELRRQGDRDVEVARLALDRWVRADRTPAPRAAPVPVPLLMTSDLEQRLALLARLEDGLAGLDDATRLTVVLRHVLGLDVADTAAVLGEPEIAVERRLGEAFVHLDLGPLEPLCHEASGALEVAEPDLAGIEARVRAGRRRRWWVGAAVAAVLVLVAAGVAVLVRPPTPPPTLAPLPVTPEDNPVGLAWWLGGTLHLEHGTVPVPGVRHLVEAGEDVVYGDGNGRVVSVAPDGSRTELGRMDVGTPLVSSPRGGLVAWMEPDAPVIAVWQDGRTHTLEAEPGTSLVAWDGDRLYVSEDGLPQAVTLDPDGLTMSAVDPPLGGASGPITDVAGDVQLWNARDSLSVVQPGIAVTVRLPGTSGQLSPDGLFVLTVGRPGGPAAYSAATGEPTGTWFPDDWTPMAAAFTRTGRVVWSVSRVGSYSLIDCLVSRGYVNSFAVDSEPCTRRVDLHGIPVLAGGEPGLVPST